MSSGIEMIILPPFLTTRTASCNNCLNSFTCGRFSTIMILSNELSEIANRDSPSIKGMFFIYPPKVKDVANNNTYPVFSALFMTSQEDIEDLMAKNNTD